jgi:hypothetical protein
VAHLPKVYYLIRKNSSPQYVVATLLKDVMIWKANRLDQLVLDVYSAFFNQRRNFQLSMKVLKHAALSTFFPDTKT